MTERRVDGRRGRDLEERQPPRPREELRDVEGLAAAETDDRRGPRQALLEGDQLAQLEGLDEVDAGQRRPRQLLPRTAATGRPSSRRGTAGGRSSAARRRARARRPSESPVPRGSPRRSSRHAVRLARGSASGRRTRGRSGPRPGRPSAAGCRSTSARISRPPRSTRSWAVGPSKITRSTTPSTTFGHRPSVPRRPRGPRTSSGRR